MLKIFASGLALAALTSAASAAGPEFCAEYATAAVNQARAAHSAPGCAPGAQGSRWSPDYRVHYSWCLGAAPPAVAEELAIRTNFLRNCRG